jgi:hypothetical protein
MKRILLAVFLLINAGAFSQKIESTDEKIMVDGKEYASYTKDGCKTFSQTCKVELSDLFGSKELIVMYRNFNDYSKVEAANPKGNVNYYEFIFLKSKKKAEIPFPGVKLSKLFKEIVKAGLFKDGKIDQNAIEEFILVNGTAFSDRQNKIKN